MCSDLSACVILFPSRTHKLEPTVNTLYSVCVCVCVCVLLSVSKCSQLCNVHLTKDSDTPAIVDLSIGLVTPHTHTHS